MGTPSNIGEMRSLNILLFYVAHDNCHPFEQLKMNVDSLSFKQYDTRSDSYCFLSCSKLSLVH